MGLDLRLPRHRPPPINGTEAQSSRRLPQHLIGGAIGSTGNMVSNLFGAGPFRWLCGLLLSWTFPNISGGRGCVAQAEASTRAALATYDGTVPKALQEPRPRSTLMPAPCAQSAAGATGMERTGTGGSEHQPRAVPGSSSGFLTILDTERTLAEKLKPIWRRRMLMFLPRKSIFSGYRRYPAKQHCKLISGRR